MEDGGSAQECLAPRRQGAKFLRGFAASRETPPLSSNFDHPSSMLHPRSSILNLRSSIPHPCCRPSPVPQACVLCWVVPAPGRPPAIDRTCRFVKPGSGGGFTVALLMAIGIAARGLACGLA